MFLIVCYHIFMECGYIIFYISMIELHIWEDFKEKVCYYVKKEAWI